MEENELVNHAIQGPSDLEQMVAGMQEGELHRRITVRPCDVAKNPSRVLLQKWRIGALAALKPDAKYPIDSAIAEFIERINALELFATFSSCAGHAGRPGVYGRLRKKSAEQPYIMFGTLLPAWFMVQVVIPEMLTDVSTRPVVKDFHVELKYTPKITRQIVYRAYRTNSYYYNDRLIGETVCPVLERVEQNLRSSLMYSMTKKPVETEKRRISDG